MNDDTKLSRLDPLWDLFDNGFILDAVEIEGVWVVPKPPEDQVDPTSTE